MNYNIFVSDCTMTVHQNVCKDYIVECNKPKSSKVCSSTDQASDLASSSSYNKLYGD